MKLAQLLLAGIISFSVGVKASAPAEVDTIAKDFEATKKKLEDAELKQRQVLSALYQLNKKIKKIVTDRGEMSQQRAFLEVNIRNLSQKVEELEQKNKSQKALLAERLRAIYKLGGPSLARFVFSSSSSVNLERNLKILGIVAGRDMDMIKNYSRDLKELQNKKKMLANRLESLKSVEQKIVSQEKQLRKEQELKGKLLDGIRKSKLFALNKINGLREKSLQFNIDDTGLFDLLFKPSFADQKGELPSPLAGVITKKFGLMKGDDHPYTLTQKGIFISAAKGSPIKSVFDGKVSYIGELPGFGKTLIVDHGDHYYSVYAHAEEVKVNTGDEITQSQIIAQVGDAPQESNPGLYFEIRHFSEPYDPQQWMKGL
ncbi:peptidoglycan DD-metalloendopeptidase family protein [Bdellovibrio sp. 22V]|uniref:murein hydrolase activator EnvC family protein n=1 Tax=Bdellovibrio TaxID=958 RepID=UPI0025435968|nr:peptidoglycan DD-metalloendopeptidase family protein [Bdellovibrio sp. 22V]WII72683.1 peptidoglycan DD-metalloendopeptidase family protein [Bdellovibrio sp. 22V]